MKTLINIQALISITILLFVLFIKNSFSQSTYTMDFTNSLTYVYDCASQLNTDHWEVKNQTCTLGTPSLTASGSSGTVSISYDLKVNQSGSLTAADQMIVQHQINSGAWVTDANLLGNGSNSVFDVSNTISLNNGDAIKFRFVGNTTSNSKFWQIKSGQFNVQNVVIGGAVMPIELGKYYAKIVENYVVLEWETFSETNNNFFIIERSKDCKNFTQIQIIQGANNSKDKI